MKSKNGLAWQTLIELTLSAAIVVWIAGFVAPPVLEAMGIGTSHDVIDSAETLVKNLNEGPYEQHQEIITLDEGNALIGFGKDKNYQCIWCNPVTGKLYHEVTTQIPKPDKEECKGSACICLCKKRLEDDKLDEEEQKKEVPQIYCKEYIKCYKLNHDLYPQYDLTSFIKENYPKGGAASGISWRGGFFIGRNFNGISDIFIGGIYSNDVRSRTIYREKKRLGQNTYVAVCPKLPCIQIPEGTTFTNEIT